MNRRWRRGLRWQRPAALGPLVLAVGASCGPVPPPPPSGAPHNACPPDSCAAYPSVAGLAASCDSNGQCVSSSAIDVTLVVSLPLTSFSAPGVSFALQNFLTKYLANKANLCGPACAVLPNAANPQGALKVDPSTEGCAGRPSDFLGAIIPASVEFRPLWSASPTSTVTLPAPAVGLPLLSVSAHTFGNLSLGGTGPSGAPPTQWSGSLAPGRYEEDVVPVDPNYPPARFTATFSGESSFQPIAMSIDTGECTPPPPAPPLPGNTTFTVAEGTTSLEGFTVFAREAATQRRISSLATLASASGGPVKILTSTVLTAAGLWPTGSELVVAPPRGQPVPTYADTIAPVATLGQVNFPPLPPPVTVSGFVVGPDGITPIDADLVIDSTPPSTPPTPQTPTGGGILICSTPDCTSVTSASGVQRPLSYSTTAHATRATGYSVVLPPGDYEVEIVPAAGSGAGMVSTPFGIQAYLQGAPPVAAGKTLKAAALATITGIAKLADGRPLAGASVEAHAAVALAAMLDPVLGRTDPRRWPRAVSGVTDAAGTFSLSVDPGVYDLVVRPQDGTGFPWVTLTSQSVGAGGTLSFSLPTTEIVVPVPVLVDMTLEDTGRNAIAGAVVRAYYSLPQASASTPGGPPPEVQLGAWLTDSAGHFSMFITPPVQ